MRGEEKFGLAMQLVLHICYFSLFEGRRKSPVLHFLMFDLYNISFLEFIFGTGIITYIEKYLYYLNILNVVYSLQHWIATRYSTRKTRFDRSFEIVIKLSFHPPHT
jgi:hypothetical protein